MGRGLLTLVSIVLVAVLVPAAAWAAPLAPPATPDTPPAPSTPAPRAPSPSSGGGGSAVPAPPADDVTPAEIAAAARAARARAARDRRVRAAAGRRAEALAQQQLKRIEALARATVEAERAADLVRPSLRLRSVADQRMRYGTDVGKYFTAALILTCVGLFLLMFFRADPAYLLTTGICLTVFAGNWQLVGLPPLDRAFIAAGAIALLARIGPSRDRPVLRPGLVHVALVAIAVYAILSALWAGTLTQSEGLFGLLDKLGFIPFLLFTIAPLAFATARQRLILVGGFVIVGAYLGVTALAETLGLDALVFPGYILDESVGIHQGRARGPFVEAAALGAGLFACGVAAAMALVLWRGRRSRVAAGVVLALCAMGTLFTLTRAVWLGTVIATLVTLAVAPGLRRFIIPVVAVGAIAVLAALAFVPNLAGSAQQRESEQRPVWDRLNLLSAGERAIEDHPLVGIGWASTVGTLDQYLRQDNGYPLTGEKLEIHNVFLANAVELGLVGVTLWALALALALGGAVFQRGPPELRIWRFGLIAVAVQWLVLANFVPLFFSFANLAVWTFAGVVSAQYAAAPTPSAQLEGAPSHDTGRPASTEAPIAARA